MTHWEDPPPSSIHSPNDRQAATRALVSDLKAHPGKWAIHRDKFAQRSTAHVAASRIRKTYAVETCVRKRADGYAVYVRWVD